MNLEKSMGRIEKGKKKCIWKKKQVTERKSQEKVTEKKDKVRKKRPNVFFSFITWRLGV